RDDHARHPDEAPVGAHLPRLGRRPRRRGARGHGVRRAGRGRLRARASVGVPARARGTMPHPPSAGQTAAAPPSAKLGATRGRPPIIACSMGLVRRAKIAAVVLAVAIVVIAQRLGIFHLTSDPVRLKQAILDLGPWGYAAFIGAYTVLQPFGVPGTVFVVA